MRLPLLIALLASAVQANIQGLDVSHSQKWLNYTEAHSMGIKFVYIQATDGSAYTDPRFSAHYSGATDAGFLRNAYHVGRPTSSSGAFQAKFFVSHGGGWNKDGMTLPGMLRLEGDCHEKPKDTVDWIGDFSKEYHNATTRYPVISTTETWWVICTGNSDAFKDTHALRLEQWRDSPGSIPGKWPWYTFWQYKDSSAWGGNSDVFNGDLDALKKLASG